jgi:hypothetical protein
MKSAFCLEASFGSRLLVPKPVREEYLDVWDNKFRLSVRASAMASHYVKWRHEYQVPFGHYVRGDPTGRRYRADIWWYIHFFNRWGDLAHAHPETVLAVRYEDLLADPEASLRRVVAHLRVDLSDRAIAVALRFIGRDAIRALLDPTGTEVIVPTNEPRAAVMYGPEDEAFIRNTCARHLRHDFGYGQK